ncbi:hypothetical protein PINS_up006829 [Pythium insidiosum]|nr:hypothetical protein PINS_up006829 [Pythium insidiosum]
MSDPITDAANERQAALDKLVEDLVDADKKDSSELLAARAQDSVLDNVRPWSDFAEQQDMAVNKNDDSVLDNVRPWSDFVAQEDMAATKNDEDPVLGELRSWNDFASENDLAVDARELSADARLRFNRRGLEAEDTNRRRSLGAQDVNRRRNLEADDVNRRRSLEAEDTNRRRSLGAEDANRHRSLGAEDANRRRSLEADDMQRRRQLADEAQRGRGHGHLADESLGRRHHHLQAQDFMAAGNDRALAGASGDMPQMFGGAFLLVAAIALFAGFVRRRKQATSPPKSPEFDYQLYM